MNLTINGESAINYGATLLTADYGYNKVTNYTDWLRGAHSPLYFGQDITYTTASFSFLVEAESLNELDKNCSDLAAAMAESIVKEDNSDWSLEGHVTGVEESNRISPLAREIDVKMEGIKIAERETKANVMTYNEPWEFEIKGNQKVPCVITVLPDMGYTELDITLNNIVYRINNIESDSLVLNIDSEQGLVTLDGENKIEDYESWELPYLIGGTNTLMVNGTPTIKVSYVGRWM